MKKTIILASVFSLMALVGTAQNNKPAAKTPDPATASAASADFKFDEEVFDFGTIKQGDEVHHDFKFTNVGKEPLVINEAHGSCGCTVPDWPKQPIKKGEAAVIKVTFNSTGKMGTQDKTVTITSNAKSGSKVLHLKGNVIEKTDKPAAN